MHLHYGRYLTVRFHVGTSLRVGHYSTVSKDRIFLLNPLRGIEFSYILILIALISMIVLGMVGYFITPRNVLCVTSQYSAVDDFVQLSFLYYSIPLVFSSLADVPSLIYSLELICSQAIIGMALPAIKIFLNNYNYKDLNHGILKLAVYNEGCGL